MKPTEKTKKNSSKVSSRLSLEERVPKLRFPGFEGEWERTSLGEKCKIIMGQSPDSASYNTIGVGIPLVQGNADIKNRVSCPNRHTSKPTKICRTNSVLLSVRAPVGTVGIANQTLCLGRGVCAIESDNNAFLYQFLIFKEDSWRNIEQGGTFTAINGDDIKKFTFIMPCEIEREKIATFLSLIDSRIAAQRKLVELLKKHKRGLIQGLFVNKSGNLKLRFNEFSDSWSEYQISDLFEVMRGYVLPTKETKNERDEKYCFPVYSSQTKDEGLMGYYFKFLYENAITWTTDGANAGTVHYRHGPFFCTNVCGVLLNDSGYANKCIGEILNSVAKHYVSYVGNPKLMNNVMSEIRITIPSIKEQQKIATLLTWVDSRISQSEKALIKTESIKKGLLQQLFV